MRLTRIERGHGLKHKLMFMVRRALSGFRVPDVVRTLMYRGDFFGDAHKAHTQAVLRGPSEWRVGEREIFAAFVSRLNQCLF